jgi:hypothetical protein
MPRPAQTAEQRHTEQTSRGSARPRESPQGSERASRRDTDALHHAIQIIYSVCCLAGAAKLLDELRRDLRGIPSAIRRHDTGPLFDWLTAALSYQGISDQVATDYMDRHGYAEWHDIKQRMAACPSCPKLKTYWHFYDCRYDKVSRTCAEPDHIDRCPLPSHRLRNGRLNQMAYSLYLFIRDIAGGDLVGWIEQQLQRANRPQDADRLARLMAALIDPLREVYGVSDKVLTMTLSCTLLSAPRGYGRWRETGAGMIAVDTLVHNFLHRTGILQRFGAQHAYGAACYQPGRCADIVCRVAHQIDARAFNPGFPSVFPRFVQHAMWRYCAQNGLGICNGNRINDGKSCDNIYCQIRKSCDRISLNTAQ